MYYNSILIAVDESKYSKRAADYGLRIAKELEAKIVMIYIVNSLDVIGSIDSGVFPDEVLKSEREKGYNLLESYLNKFGCNLVVEKLVREGEPAKEILKAAVELNVDLIVIGRHGLESFRHLIFGGVVDEVAKQTHIPVLLVPYIE